ncbi:acyltransferase [Duganella sp. Leaf126]|uniref:acyltransferase family protein n=1 Tax=Duganella sp. Leaf126 TaxID=1736266 RepID=UPI0009E955EC|nr:acyltransferase [Duganella sp. Leaf126]
MHTASPSSSEHPVAAGHGAHLSVLDGWRGLSILMVLAAHLLPLGPHHFLFNHSAGVFGMVIFFILSGFLITSFLVRDQRIGGFLVKRFCRVLPLAWLYMVIALLLSLAPLSRWASHLLFYANLPLENAMPNDLVPMTEHLWSLCMELQFYVGVALLVAVLRGRGLLLLPFLGLAFTALRWHDSVIASSVSYYRIDEILAGCTLALIFHGKFGERARECLRLIPLWPIALLLVFSCMPQGEWLNYLRPYLALLLVGGTLMQPTATMVLGLHNRALVFVAGISYALYVIHPMLTFTWLGSGDVIVKYLKRPLFFAVLFVLAYGSTRYYESWFMKRGKRWADTVNGWFTPRPAPVLSVAITADVVAEAAPDEVQLEPVSVDVEAELEADASAEKEPGAGAAYIGQREPTSILLSPKVELNT